MTATIWNKPHFIVNTIIFNQSVFLSSVFIKRAVIRCLNWLIVLGIIFSQSNSYAQSYEKLNNLKGYQTAVYFSTGTEAKAKRMATQLDKVIAFYNLHLQFTPSVTLLVLSPDDWSTYTTFPFYGMPHYTSNKTLVVASEDNDYWKSLVPDFDKIPEAYAKLVTESYSDKKGGVTMEPFFDLLAIHELGHAYHNQGGLVMQRRWLGELVPNILLHTYIAENEPLLLPALTTFPKMVVATINKSVLKYTTLEELEVNYNVIGPQYPENYGWYQCRWHIAAGEIYDAGNIQVLKNIWNTLKAQKDILNDADLSELLKIKVDKSVADVQLNWDRYN